MVSASRDTTLRLWDLKGLTAGLLPRCFLDGAMPRGQVDQYMTHSQQLLSANQLELSVRASSRGKPAMGAAKQEEVLQEAALLQLQAGHAEQCCELLVEAGEWDKALVLAPAASQEYWAKLLRRRADAEAKRGAGTRELLPLLLAGGQAGALVELLLAGKQYGLAASVAAVQACGGYQHFSTATSTTAAPLSPTPVPGSPTRASAAAAQTSAAASAHAGGMLSPLGAHSAALQLLASPEHPLLGARRNSLSPLRGVAGAPTSCSGGLQHSVSTAAAALDRSGSFGMPSSPGSVRPASPLSPVAEAAAAGEGDKGLGGGSSSRGMDAVLLQAPSGFARLRSGSGVLGCGVAGGGAAVDAVAMQQLAAVRQAQASSYRHQGQPLLAACAALTVNDVAGAVSALHLGHEPEQAAMLCVALGQLDGVDAGLQDRVFAALGSKCEAAGDWEAAAAVTKMLSRDVTHHLQLLVVRAERASRHSRLGSTAAAAAAAADSASSKAAGVGEDASAMVRGLRQLLGLQEASHYAAVAAAVSDPLESTRFWLLAGNHARAAARASTHLEMFAYNLLAGALKAFSYSYMVVGSFLMLCLRRWLEQHQVKFPLCRAALLVLEASAVAGSCPEAACSLLMAAADSQDTPANITSAARQRLQGFPRAPTVPAAAAAACIVVPAGSCLPFRGPAGCSRSAVSGKAIEGPWVLLDDGCSAASLAEGVMLAHVMRCGPFGCGKVLQLL
ncbi:hypothetical protein OEZ85_009420 [Tetradesmus obliquus]|uniref:Uncharacterized protein n=1 Tax=Tetradesmus obliquus TaxID=3088 RepID=A0ABY8UC25_TETOB|nr:hypothetical protein OEZ85_009420 [Tetradesmus obliquus]